MNNFIASTRLLILSFIIILLFIPNNSFASTFNPKSFTLENGMQVILIENKRAPVVSHMIWYKVGAADEPIGKSGIAHFLEHLMFTGTDKISPNEFSKIIKKHGGQDNAFTSHDYTAYFQNIAVEKLPMVMEMEADRMQNLKLSERVIQRERQVIIEERNQRTDNNPSAILSEAMYSALFANHPYGIPIIGWRHEIEKLTLQDALNFYQKYYRPNNAILVVSGDIDIDELKILAHKYYGVLKNPNDKQTKYIRNWSAPAPIKTDIRITYRDNKVKAPIYKRLYRAPKGSYALELLSNILGEGATSILYKELLVKKKMVTSIGSSYDAISYDNNNFTIYFQPVSGHKIADIEMEIDKIITKILQNGISKDEITTAKNKLIDSAIYARDSLQYPAMIFGRAITSGFDIDYIENWQDNIKNTTAKNIQDAAKVVFAGKNKAVVGILMPDIKN